MIARLLFLILFFSAIEALSQENQPCTDLADLSYSPDTVADGTGVIANSEEVIKRKKQVLGFVENNSKPKLETLLSSQQNSSFRDLSLRAFGLTDHPLCLKNDPKSRNQCNRKITTELTALAKKQLVPTYLSYEEKTSLEGRMKEVDQLLNDSRFQEFLRTTSSDTERYIADNFSNKTIGDLKKFFDQDIKGTLIEEIGQWPISEEDKIKLKNSIEQTNFKGTDCVSMGFGSTDFQVPASLFPGAFHLPNGDIYYCSSMDIAGNSFFQIAFTLTHELAHSLSPCVLSKKEIGFSFQKTNTIEQLDRQNPMFEIINCMRSNTSVGSTNLSFSTEGKNSYIPRNTDPSRNLPTDEKADVCNKDSIEEDLPDWIASELLVKLVEKKYPNLTKKQWVDGMSNVLRFGCRHERRDDWKYPLGIGAAPQPPVSRRINATILQNPATRRKMGCPANHPKYSYCGFSNHRGKGGQVDTGNKSAIE